MFFLFSIGNEIDPPPSPSLLESGGCSLLYCIEKITQKGPQAQQLKTKICSLSTRRDPARGTGSRRPHAADDVAHNTQTHK
jgi:hypothetical protein